MLERTPPAAGRVGGQLWVRRGPGGHPQLSSRGSQLARQLQGPFLCRGPLRPDELGLALLVSTYTPGHVFGAVMSEQRVQDAGPHRSVFTCFTPARPTRLVIVSTR